MNGQVINTLFDWASKNNRKTQREFASFWGKHIDAYRFDESCGADGSGRINMTMADRIIEEFQANSLLKESNN